MQTISEATPANIAVTGRSRLWTGRILSALAVLFMLMDGGMKLFNPPPVVESMTELGFSQSQTVVVGAIALACVLLYLVPRTAVLGAILLTGYLGGAIAAQVRINAPVFSLVFPLMIAALFWGGLYLRDGRVAAIIARPD